MRQRNQGQVAVVESGTTRRQRVIAGTIADLARRVADAGASGPALLIVGEVAGLAARKSIVGMRVRVAA